MSSTEHTRRDLAAQPPLSLTLSAVNAGVYSVHMPDGLHVGNLKQVGAAWKFKAVGYGANDSVEPGGGPLTDQHNTVFEQPDATEVSARLAPHLR